MIFKKAEKQSLLSFYSQHYRPILNVDEGEEKIKVGCTRSLENLDSLASVKQKNVTKEQRNPYSSILNT